MGARTFKGSSLEECLKTACSEMNISLNALKYTVISERKSIFRKETIISVEEPEIIVEDDNGKICVEDGKIIVQDPVAGKKPASLCPGLGVYLIVNGSSVDNSIQVYEKDEISYLFEENESQRLLDIKVSENKLEAFLTIKYIPLIKYKLRNCSITNILTLEKEVNEEIMPPKYTSAEIKAELEKVGIKFGIREMELEEFLQGNSYESFLVAKGIPAVNDTNDVIDYKFQAEHSAAKFDDNNYNRVDYKNINVIAIVKKGDIVAEKKAGIVGKDGKDIFGKVIKKKDGKRRIIKVGAGCELKDENTAVALVDGRPNIKNNIIYVNEQYEVSGDVDIKTGNVKFIGDVNIRGSVLEGMRVEAGGAIEVEKSVESANILATGDIQIKGNVIMSTITAGGNDVINLRRIGDLEEFSREIKALQDTVIEIKKFNLLGNNKEDGEVIKVLLETKFKYMTKTCVNIIKDSVYNESKDIDRVVALIREMLVGMAPLGIKNYGQLDDLIIASKEKVDELKQNLAIPVKVLIDYCQDSHINSSGDIIVTGKGEYVSTITAYNSVSFTNEKSVARGGEIYAGDEIRCMTVGSSGGVATKIAVGEHGHIWINTAYQNTKLQVGEREFILDIAYKSIHAFQDSKGELIVERLKL